MARSSPTSARAPGSHRGTRPGQPHWHLRRRERFHPGAAVSRPPADPRLTPGCFAIYNILLVEGPPFSVSYDDLVRWVAEQSPADPIDEVEGYVASLRDCGYLFRTRVDGHWICPGSEIDL